MSLNNKRLHEDRDGVSRRIEATRGRRWGSDPLSLAPLALGSCSHCKLLTENLIGAESRVGELTHRDGPSSGLGAANTRPDAGRCSFSELDSDQMPRIIAEQHGFHAMARCPFMYTNRVSSNCPAG